MEALRVEASLEKLHFLKSTDPPIWLAPSPALSEATRIASQSLFSKLKPFSPKSPFDHLLVDGFDAEQIWQQIDLQSQPLLARICRDLKRFEKNPEEISKLKVGVEGKKKVTQEIVEGIEEDSDDMEEDTEDFDEEEEEVGDEEGEDNDGEEEEEEEDGDLDEGDEEESDNDEDEGKGGEGGIEDGFLKIKELEEFLEEDEVREYGLQKNNKKSKKEKKPRDREDEETDDDEDEEDEELGEFDLGDEDEDASKLEQARYEDFFTAKAKNPGSRKSNLTDESEDSDSDDEGDDGELEEQKSENLSTHQKHLKKIQSEIELMETANLEPKTWTMRGEVTAEKRPKNSALEVDLDFEHNVRPAPVITEEVTATLEEMIQKRILEGRFDDVQKAPERPTKAPREFKELDENKSKKGLGEIYEQEYVEKTNFAGAPSSLSDEMKKEASMLFKKLCLKLDALSHFHFAPKPVIEDMSIQVNVPALAMEEIAPVAVSEAAMLAPEEVFTGKGAIKEEAELTQSERKRRRANKKRRYKAMVTKRDAKKARTAAVSKPNEG